MNALTIAAQSTSTKFSNLVADRLFNKTDAMLDQAMALINDFREYRLYEAPSEVPLADLDAVQAAFEDAAQRNIGATGFRDALAFNFAVMRVRLQVSKKMVKMEQGIATYHLLQAMFRL